MHDKWEGDQPNKFERTISNDLMNSNFLENKAQFNLHLKINELSMKSEEKLQKTSPKESLTKIQTMINYNKLLTDKIQTYIKNVDEKISFLFEPFVSFSKMDVLFGLGKGYILRQRMDKNHSKIIAKDILDRMRLSLQNLIKIWTITYPNLSEDLINVQKDLINFINEYEGEVNPKPSSHYQMYNHHPNFIRDYFKVINKKEKAYWLGFIFADGWISRTLKKSGYYYRMGIGLSTKDKNVLVRFCNSIGLNQDYIKDRLSGSDFSEKKYPISMIRWGDQEFAKDLINLGVEYEYSQTKRRRVKIPKMPSLDSRELMLAFLLGFYDGDGTLGFNKSTERIQPNLACSNKKFLLDIKNYFDIRNKISSREIENYSIKKDKIVKTQASSLNIGTKLFEELLKNYSHSMNRKKVDLTFFKDCYTPKKKPPTPQRTWLRNKLPKETLEELLNIISPNMVAKMLGVSRSTILRLIEEYGTSFLTAGHYLRIIRSVRNDRKSSDFYESYNRWINYLKKIGKFSNK
ncbi:MAG: LAGLIDADG family homing endonuclease [Promethearchaeota archaeon]